MPKTVLPPAPPNGQAVVDSLPPAPDAEGIRRAHRIQNAWLQRMRGQPIAVRLGSGEVITGVLAGDDAFTLALRVSGFTETALVYKHSVEYVIPNPRA